MRSRRSLHFTPLLLGCWLTAGASAVTAHAAGAQAAAPEGAASGAPAAAAAPVLAPDQKLRTDKLARQLLDGEADAARTSLAAAKRSDGSPPLHAGQIRLLDFGGIAPLQESSAFTPTLPAIDLGGLSAPVTPPPPSVSPVAATVPPPADPAAPAAVAPAAAVPAAGAAPPGAGAISATTVASPAPFPADDLAPPPFPAPEALPTGGVKAGEPVSDANPPADPQFLAAYNGVRNAMPGLTAANGRQVLTDLTHYLVAPPLSEGYRPGSVTDTSLAQTAIETVLPHPERLLSADSSALLYVRFGLPGSIGLRDWAGGSLDAILPSIEEFFGAAHAK